MTGPMQPAPQDGCAPAEPVRDAPLRVAIVGGGPAGLMAAERRRCSQARSSGAAFISSGNTRPDVPTKVDTPSACTQARSASGPNASSSGRTRSCAAP